MRLASFLPMLLLWLGSLHAQPNCNIFDLTATAVQVNPLDCQFFVSLDFEHSGTTNQFTVTGNGNNYGTFVYGLTPVILGPFNANPNGPTVLEFVVTDAVFQDCQDEVVLEVPPCGNPITCEISNLVVETGQCDPASLTYKVFLNFQVEGASNDFFEVFAGNVSLGVFALADLPLQIPAFPASGNPVDVIKVCIVNHPNCCADLTFDAPDCVNPPCGIVDFSVQTGDCTTDSTYKAVIDFEVIAPALADSFAMWVNGQFIGNFGVNQLPLQQEFTWNGGPNDVVKVCLINTAAVCCETREFLVPDCLHLVPCGITGLKVTPDTCTSDSTFHAILDFGVNDPSAVDSFQLWLNGEYWGAFGLNQLPLHIPDFPWNGLIFNHVKVCTGNLPACCKEYQFLAPDCLPFGPCEITDIFLQTGPCTSDSTYKVTLNFNATNPGNGTFTVSLHNDLIDTFNLTDVPLMLELPWNGQQGDFITVCILGADSVPGAVGCCRIKQFNVPACLFPCSIVDVSLDPGDCDPLANTFQLHLDFEAINPGNALFEVWGNGEYLGVFPLNALPILIPNFPANGNAVDVIKICINDQPDCCKTIEFQGPNCDAPCEIYDLTVQTGDCHPADSTYVVWVDFQVQNPGSNAFGLWANGQFLGTFNLNQLPLQVPNFPWDGQGPNDLIKVCIVGNSGTLSCCRTLEFPTPDCFPDGDCEIYDLQVEVGGCTSDSTYEIVVGFEVDNQPGNTFGLWANGQFYGLFNLGQLPLSINNFPWDGGQIDYLKVCFANAPGGQGDCCAETEFHVPDCLTGGDCEIFDLTVTPGPCDSSSGTYSLTFDFEVQNPGNNFYEVWVNNIYFGTHPIADLPYTIDNVSSNGNASDVIKVCINDQPNCCRVLEFPGPDCDNSGDCHIFDMVVDPGDCDTTNGTYTLHLDFEVDNPGNNFFEVWGNGTYLGIFELANLPVVIPNFPSNGQAIDVIKVCINDQPDCCKTLEFQGPNCGNGGGDCHIYDMVIDPGDCDPATGTYTLHLDFEVDNPGNNFFEVWGNGTYLGIFELANLPVVIPNFPSNGQAIDVIKVCINDQPDCCKTLEFQGPVCGNNLCDIVDLHVETGDCTGDSSYVITINFGVVNPPSGVFRLWANGQVWGDFNLNQLPLTINNFPWNGGPNDFIKVCMLPNVPGVLQCCAEAEFEVPDCIENDTDCEISNLAVIRTACLCGQFFAVLTFDYQFGGAGGFDIVGNGNNYGNFPYNTTQPIILGPFNGDGTTVYEFAVQDHNHPDLCQDDFNLGTVDCMTPVNEPGKSAQLTLSPNPANNWINVTALFDNNIAAGQSDVEIYAADGRLVQINTVANGANFQLDVSALPSGIYRLVLKTAAGRVEGTFAKG
jgi:hypothetical protein